MNGHTRAEVQTGLWQATPARTLLDMIIRVSASEAATLMREQGYVYLDVRSVPEFEASHPQGAFNVPLREPVPSGMIDNANFLAVVMGVFASDTKLVVGCAAGVRSLHACELLKAAGFDHVLDQRSGTDGLRDPFGRVREPGWNALGLESAQGRDPKRGYEALLRKVGLCAEK